MKKKFSIVLIILLTTLVFSTYIFFSTRTTKGIFHGTYSRLDDSGTIINEGSEGAWVINNNKAEYRYLVFTIVTIDENIYFEIEFKEDVGNYNSPSVIFRYEVDYDETSKVITVNMPLDGDAPSVFPNNTSEKRLFKFKKTGFSLG